MSKNGALILGVNISQKTKKIISSIDIQMRGVVIVEDNKDYLSSVQDIMIRILENHAEQFHQTGEYAIKSIIQEVKSKIKNLTWTNLKRNPIILVFINEI